MWFRAYPTGAPGFETMPKPFWALNDVKAVFVLA
jgi:hypothetical protein